ncbi:hypothetical protein D3C71_1438140 [compost metagenome]
MQGQLDILGHGLERWRHHRCGRAVQIVISNPQIMCLSNLGNAQRLRAHRHGAMDPKSQAPRLLCGHPTRIERERVEDISTGQILQNSVGNLDDDTPLMIELQHLKWNDEIHRYADGIAPAPVNMNVITNGRCGRVQLCMQVEFAQFVKIDRFRFRVQQRNERVIERYFSVFVFSHDDALAERPYRWMAQL